MERSLTYCQGKSILNSINLEDGRSRFEKVVPLARRFGAALVVGLIDEKGMAVTVERKLEVARRSFHILVEEMGVAPEDIWWDPLVFPCGTGDAAYLGSARADDRRRCGRQGAVPGLEDHPRRLQRQLRPAQRGPGGPELGLPLPLPPRRGSTPPSSTPRSWPATPTSPRRSGDLAEALIFLARGGHRSRQPGGRRPSPRTSGAVPPPPSSRAPTCRSTSASPAPSSKGARRDSRRTWTRPSPIRAGRRRSTSSTAR